MRFGSRALRRLQERDCARTTTPSVHPLLDALEDGLMPSGAFVQTNQVSDIAGMAASPDTNLFDPWGLVAGASGLWWVANEGSGASTLYNGQGQLRPANNSLIVALPTNPKGSQARFTAVNGNPNTLKVWTYQTRKSSERGRHHRGEDSSTTTTAASNSPIQQMDAIFQPFNAAVQALESKLLAIDPRLSSFFSLFNSTLDALEAMLASKL